MRVLPWEDGRRMRGVRVRAHLLQPGSMLVAEGSHLSRMQAACDVSCAAVWWEIPRSRALGRVACVTPAPTNILSAQDHEGSRVEEERGRAAEAAKREEETRKPHEDRLKEQAARIHVLETQLKSLQGYVHKECFPMEVTEDAPSPHKRKRQGSFLLDEGLRRHEGCTRVQEQGCRALVRLREGV